MVDAASGVTVGGVSTGADVGGTASLAPQADRATVAAKTPAMSEQRSIDLSPVMPIVLGRILVVYVRGCQFRAFSRLERYSANVRRPAGVACTHVRGLEFRNSLVMTR